MEMYSLLFYFYIGFISGQNVSNGGLRGNFLVSQNKLFKKLFTEYDKNEPAVYLAPESQYVNNETSLEELFQVNFTLKYIKLIVLVEPEEKFDVIIEYSMIWDDPRLAWLPLDYGGIDRIHTNIDKVWIPELTAVDALNAKDPRDREEQTVIIYSNGTIYYYRILICTLICAMNVDKFPFDGQTCRIQFTSLSYNLKEFQINPIIDTFVGIAESGNGEWQIKNLTVVKNLYTTGTRIYFSIELKRNPIFYVTMIVVPSFVINVLSIIGIFMENGDSMSRLGIGLTNIMSMTFILGILADSVPKTKALPLLAIYVLVNLTIMAVAVIAMIVIPSNDNDKKPKKLKSKEAKRSLFEKLCAYWNTNTVLMYTMQAINVANFIFLLVY